MLKHKWKRLLASHVFCPSCWAGPETSGRAQTDCWPAPAEGQKCPPLLSVQALHEATCDTRRHTWEFFFCRMRIWSYKILFCSQWQHGIMDVRGKTFEIFIISRKRQKCKVSYLRDSIKWELTPDWSDWGNQVSITLVVGGFWLVSCRAHSGTGCSDTFSEEQTKTQTYFFLKILPYFMSISKFSIKGSTGNLWSITEQKQLL